MYGCGWTTNCLISLRLKMELKRNKNKTPFTQSVQVVWNTPFFYFDVFPFDVFQLELQIFLFILGLCYARE